MEQPMQQDEFSVDEFYDQDDGLVKWTDGETPTLLIEKIVRGGSQQNPALNIQMQVINSENQANIGKTVFMSQFYKNFQGFQNAELKDFLDAFLAKPRSLGEKVGYDYAIGRLGKCKIQKWTSKKGKEGENYKHWEDMGTADSATEW